MTTSEQIRVLCVRSGVSLSELAILNKGMQAVSGRATKNYRMFPNVTESINL